MLLNLDWASIKDFADTRSVVLQYVETNDQYYLVAIDGGLEANAVIKKKTPASSDQTDFETNYKTAANAPLGNPKHTNQTGAIEVAVHKPEQSSTSFVTHDWTDKTTWFGDSVRVTDEVMSDSGDGLTFNSANDTWIDLYNCKVYNEDVVINDGPYTIEVKIDDVLQDHLDGYSIDFANGNVTFDSSQSGNTIKVTYSHENGSTWYMVPAAGKKLLIEHSELQFSKDIDMVAPITFEVWVYHPDQVTYPGLKVKYAEEKYKNIKDIVNTANLGTGSIPAIGDLTQEVIVFPFNYVSVKPFDSSIGAELRIKTAGDAALTGEWATATFYVISMDI